MPAKIKQGRYIDGEGVQQDVVFIGAEKAIFDDEGNRLDEKLESRSKASGLTVEDTEGILGVPEANVNFQALVNAIANKVMNDLVAKTMLSNIQINSSNNIPTSSLVYLMNEDLAKSKELLQNIVYSNAGAHNSIYRGKNLGTSVTEEQWTEIYNGTFDDLFIGDFWTIGGVNWRIAAFDYFYNCGDVAFARHHAVIVPDTYLYAHNMNDTNITTGAYVGSKMHTEGLEQAKTTINNAFGSSHVLSHRIYLSNATSNGCASAGAWADSTVDLMCEHMVYGSGIFSPVSDGSTIPNNYRVEKGQLPLFALAPQYIHNHNMSYWLRDVISAAYFASVGTRGLAYYNSASYAYGVRPHFCIG